MNEWLTETLGLSPSVQLSVGATLAILVAVMLLRRAARRVVMARVDDARLRYRWCKNVSYGAYAVLFIGVASIWIKGIGSLATYLGLASAGLAIALQSLVLNLAGWIYLISRRPFEVGDRIQVKDHIGDVVDIGTLTFTLLEVGNWVQADQSSGRVIHVPNGVVFGSSVTSYTGGFHYLWDELPVLLTFESDWQAARGILCEIVRDKTSSVSLEASQRAQEPRADMMIYYGTLEPTVYTSVAASGVLLTMRFLCEPRKRRDLEQSVWEAVLLAFAARDDIDFAYPTVRYYGNTVEGKPGARAKAEY